LLPAFIQALDEPGAQNPFAVDLWSVQLGADDLKDGMVCHETPSNDVISTGSFV
jgi:hypothetical protein